MTEQRDRLRRFDCSRGIWALVIALLVVITGWYPIWAQGQSRALSINADTQEANANTGVITATGNVTISYPAEQVTARAQKATYFTKEQRIFLEGQVTITQKQNQLQAEKVTYLVREGTIQAAPTSGKQVESIYVLPETSAPAAAGSPSP